MINKITKNSLSLLRTFPKAFHTFSNTSLRQITIPKIGLPYQNIKYMFSVASHENVSKGSFQGAGFYVEQLLTGCLSVYSYYIESNGQAFLVDPMNETIKYQQLLEERKAKLKGVFMTHYHADYIAGHLQLQRKYGCQMYMGPGALQTFGIKVLKDQQTIKLGSINLKLIHTPGHTEESSCLLLQDSNNSQKCLFTGDTMFLNEVGRPDLAVKSNLTAKDLATMLYSSIQKIKKFNNDIRIYPGHGAGSSCGKAIGKGDFCTLGTQKQNNYALKADSSEKFVSEILDGMPNPPQYFGHDVGINKFNPFDYGQIQNIVMKKLSAQKVATVVKEHAVIIDVRSKEDIKEGLIEGAIAVDFNGPFATWLGTIFSPKGRYVVYGNNQKEVKETIKRMLRIGYINIDGYCTSSLEEMSKYGKIYKPQITENVIEKDRIVLDVRKPGQWQKGVVAGNTVKFELGNLFKNHEQLDKDKKYIVHCQSGYRSRIAYTFLKNNGYEVKAYVEPFDSIEKSGVKIEK